jgi:glycosyltransferase involved in cell wall biosynthesis
MLKIDYWVPKISCLMITAGGRFDYFKDSYRCYRDQTYQNKELVIVTDSDKDYKNQISTLVDGQDDVRLVFLNGRYTLGALRNISMHLCTGDVFVQWDDDDFNMPDRLMVQYGWLLKSGNRVSYFSDQLHYYFPTQELYWENWWEFGSNFSIRYGLIPGTLMAFRDGFDARYPSAGKHAKAGEDSILSDDLVASTSVSLLKRNGNLQVYSYHGKNVWDLEHHLNITKWRSHDIQFMNQHRQIINKTLKYMNFSPTVRVMGRDGLAFVYEVNDVD